MAQGSRSGVAEWALLLRRSKEKMREGLHALQPWAWTLKRIGGAVPLGLESRDGPGLRGSREEGLGAWTQKGPATCLLPPAGQFGAGTESYFSLLRFLLLLNVLASVLKACMTLLPTWLDGAPPGPPDPDVSSPCGSYNPHPEGLVPFSSQLFNLLSGEVSACPLPPRQGDPLRAPLHLKS